MSPRMALLSALLLVTGSMGLSGCQPAPRALPRTPGGVETWAASATPRPPTPSASPTVMATWTPPATATVRPTPVADTGVDLFIGHYLLH